MVKVVAKMLTFTTVMVDGKPKRKRVRKGEVIEWIGKGDPPASIYDVVKERKADAPEKRKPGRPKKATRASDTLVSEQHMPPKGDDKPGLAGFDTLPS